MNTRNDSDQHSIQQLAHRFENAFDAADLEGHMATWADTMTFESPFGTYRDRAAYRAWVASFIEQTRAMGGTRHLVGNVEIELDGDSATMLSTLTILNRRTRSIIATGSFRDVVRRIDGTWRFERRVLEVDQDLSVLTS